MSAPIRTRWGLVLLLCATATAGYLCRVNISVAGALLMQEYQLSQIEMGRVFSAFLAGYALCQLPGGLLADRCGARRVMAVLGWLWVILTAAQAAAGLGSLGSSAATVVGTLIVLRFLLGTVAAPTYPAAVQGVSRWALPAAHGRANGIVVGSVGLGSALAPPFVTAVMTSFGWRMALLASAVPALIVALIWLRVREPADQPLGGRAAEGARHAAPASARLEPGAPRLWPDPRLQGGQGGAQCAAPDSVGPGSAGLSASARSVTARPGRSSMSDVGQPGRQGMRQDGLLSLLRTPGVLLLTLSYSLQGYVGYIFVFWFYLYLVQVRHFDLMQGAVLGAIPWILSIVSIPLGGFISDALVRSRLGPVWGRRVIPMVGMAGSGIFISIGAHTLNPYLAAASLSVATALVMSVEGPFWASMVSLSGARSGAGGGIMNTGCNIGGLISPALTPVLAASMGWEPALHLAAGLAVLAGVLWLWITPRPPAIASCPAPRA